MVRGLDYIFARGGPLELTTPKVMLLEQFGEYVCLTPFHHYHQVNLSRRLLTKDTNAEQADLPRIYTLWRLLIH